MKKIKQIAVNDWSNRFGNETGPRNWWGEQDKVRRQVHYKVARANKY